MHRFDAAVVFTRRLHRLRQLSRFAECAMAQTAVAAAEDSAFEAAAIATIITTKCITIVSVTGGGGGDRSSLCSTPSSCDGVECLFAFP